jgi:valyl-tRNA synthetase
MDSRYIPQDHEQQIYDLWEKHQAFNPDSDVQQGTRPGSNKPAFSILLPPPNANDPLHVGHAMYTIEDVLIRYHRMLGDDTLWLPGTDHAGIETQFVYEKKLQKEDKSRFDFDRETLYSQIWDYVQTNSETATEQLKRLGFSLDWSRFTFMLDPKAVEIVVDTFKQLHEDKLVYRDVRLVNFCTRCGTSFSELEVVHVDRSTPLYYIKYRFAENPSEYVVIATTRPEPIFVDTHIAVHPDNPKTKHLIGKQLLNPITDKPMTVITDKFVDPEFGTGIVKMTPAHDHTDFTAAQTHNLPIIEAITKKGRIADNGGKYGGLKIKAAREMVVADLQEKGLIDHIDEQYQHRIGTCYRCGTVLEPLPLPQFFVKVKPLVEKALTALDKGEVVVHGAGHDKILRHWLENLYDWNISRQIVWGIRIPVWYSVENNPTIHITFITKTGERVEGTLSELLPNHSLEEITRGLQELQAPVESEYIISPTSPGEGYLQETDTFDTWFSSAQWPYTTLMSNKPGDFERFYPTSVMETGYDILPFWVMRMLLMGIYKTNQVPFKNVYLHGLIRDAKGKKMSKSKGNVINPLAVTEEYGADALRMALVIRSSPGLDKSVGQPDFKAMRNLTNKIWNAARFITLLHSDDDSVTEHTHENDGRFNEKLNQVIVSTTQQLNDFKIGLAAETLYNEFWHWFCDESIEQAKSGSLSKEALFEGLVVFLKLLHPFAPFVTETIWQSLQEKGLLTINDQSHQLLIVSEWPQSVH